VGSGNVNNGLMKKTKMIRKRGVGTVIGGILFVVLVVSSLLALYSFFGAFNSYVGNVTQSIKLNVAKSSEELLISNGFISSGVLSFTLTDAGSTTVTLTDLWIYDTNTKALCCGDTTGVPPTTFAASASVLSPGEAVTFTTSNPSQFSTTISSLSSSDTYAINVETLYGNAFSFQVGPTSSSGIAFSSSSASCTDSSSTAQMMGFGMLYTPSLTGRTFVTLDFEISLPSSTTGATSSYQLVYGTGTAPTCNSASTGTIIGNSYTVQAQKSTMELEGEVTVVITSLSPGVTYWFDVRVTDPSGGTFTYSAPQLSVIEK
jgi:hypothetical protein